MTESILNYTLELQELFVRMMITDAGLFTRVSNILKSENFDKKLRPAVKFISEFSEEYSSIPDPDKIKAVTGIELKTIDGGLRDSDIDFFLKEFEDI